MFSNAKVWNLWLGFPLQLYFPLSLLILFGSLCLVAPAQEAGPPKELVEYVDLARKAGISEAEIQANASKAGWPPEMISAALTATHPAPVPSPPRSTPSEKDVAPKDPAPAAIPPSPSTTPATAPAATLAGIPADEYHIGEGDVLQINVFGEPTASVPAATVRPDGKISVPLLKEIYVAGMTPVELERIVTTQLADMIRAPNVTVVVAQINSKKIYLTGAVKKEGPIPYTYRMTVMQAISEAGGLTDYAKKKKIYILRNESGKQYRLKFSYDEVLKGERQDLNVPLIPGDQIVVPH
jgi:polysaccharide export outer membrane protein